MGVADAGNKTPGTSFYAGHFLNGSVFQGIDSAAVGTKTSTFPTNAYNDLFIDVRDDGGLVIYEDQGSGVNGLRRIVNGPDTNDWTVSPVFYNFSYRNGGVSNTVFFMDDLAHQTPTASDGTTVDSSSADDFTGWTRVEVSGSHAVVTAGGRTFIRATTGTGIDVLGMTRDLTNLLNINTRIYFDIRYDVLTASQAYYFGFQTQGATVTRTNSTGVVFFSPSGGVFQIQNHEDNAVFFGTPFTVVANQFYNIMLQIDTHLGFSAFAHTDDGVK
jgi:hypothetical protein